MIKLGIRIKDLREKRGISQEKLGLFLYPQSNKDAVLKKMQRTESGNRDISAVELFRIAEYFNVSPLWLAYGEVQQDDSGWTEDLRSLCRDVKLVMESGDHITAMALRQNIAAFKESVLRKTKIDGKQEVATSDSQDPRPGKDVPTTAAAGESSGKKKAM